jgi:hypothetical protein
MAATRHDDCAAADHFFAVQHEKQTAVATATMEKPALWIATRRAQATVLRCIIDRVAAS